MTREDNTWQFKFESWYRHRLDSVRVESVGKPSKQGVNRVATVDPVRATVSVVELTIGADA